MNNPNIGTLHSTFYLKNLDGVSVPFQNNIPYPSFDPQERLNYSLSGTWKKKRFNADHNWTMSSRDKKWILKTEMEANGITKRTYNDCQWENHYIPLPENKLTGKAEVNGAETYENGVWYRKKFMLNKNWDDKVVTLKCLGLSYIGDFWINDQYVGYHEGGYTPFSFDVTSIVHSGENQIVVRVDNPAWTSRQDIVPAVNNDFFNYTGIIQDIFLEATDSIQVVRANIVPRDISGDVDITLVLENRTNTSKVVTPVNRIYRTDFTSDNWLSHPNAKSICKQKIEVNGFTEDQVKISPYETCVINYKITIPNPEIWSIRTPNLYVFETLLYENNTRIDSFYSQFGIRTTKTETSMICLNEEPIFLAGVARHEEWPGYGRTATWNRIKSDFLKINDLSVNMVRTGHYPNHIYTFIMLDRLGLTSMSEIPLWQFETHHYQIQEKRQISYQMWREMIFSNFNRPSIILWSTQNESKDVKLRKQYNENLVNELRNLYNDGRLITQSAAADQPGFADESMAPLDVAGWTMYFGVFHGSTPYEGTRDFIEKAHEKWPHKPILNTEYGLWSNADKSFIEQQVQAYRKVHQALIEKAIVTPEGYINENGFVTGIDYWTIFDWYVNHNQFYQTMGMYHMDRKTTKPLYYEFVKDHKRLMQSTNGIGKYYLDTFEKVLSIDTTQMIPGQVKVKLKHTMDLSVYNYLIIRIIDRTSRDGFTVELINNVGEISSFQTFKHEIDKEFDVMVPLWVLEPAVISGVEEIKLLYGHEREINMIEIACAMGGK